MRGALARVCLCVIVRPFEKKGSEPGVIAGMDAPPLR